VINISLHLAFIKVLCTPPMTLDTFPNHLKWFFEHVKDGDNHRHAILPIKAEQLAQHLEDTRQ
jgi:hypothetical protein